MKLHLKKLLFSIVIPLFFLSCTSFPVPKNADDSLFIVLSTIPVDSNASNARWVDRFYFSGPTPFVMDITREKWKLNFKKVKPGSYFIAKREVRWSSGAIDNIGIPYIRRFKIKPNSIYLFPQIINGRYVNSTYSEKTITPADQYKISKELPQYIGFSEWIGKNFQGFGRYRPSFAFTKEKYDVKVTSEPEDAEVFIDGVSWGKTPIITQLKAGKHQLFIKRKGFFDYRTFIDISNDTEINTKLLVVRKNDEEKKELRLDQFSVLIEPFANLGSKEFNHLIPVFADVLNVDMSLDKRLFMENTDQSSTEPNFKIAYRQGFDLLVHGQYYTAGDKIFVHAALYDVKTRRVKTSIVYSGEAGLGMFNSIDEMGQKFLNAVSRVLPEEGKRVIEEEKEINQQVITLEKKVTKEQIIDKRREQKFAYSVGGGVGGHLDYIFGGNQNITVANGPLWGVFGTLEAVLWGPLDVVLKLNPAAVFPSNSLSEEGCSEVSIFSGLQFDFSDFRTTLYTSLLGMFRYTFERTVNRESVFKIGPFYYTELFIDTGLKYYTYKKYNEKASFFNAGFMFGLRGHRYNINFKEAFPVNIDITMYFGFGSRI